MFPGRLRELLVVSDGFFFRSCYPYSTISASHGKAAASVKTHLVDYLIDSLGFSREDAISASSKSKVTHLKSTLNADSVVNLFKDYGLDQTQIRDIVSTVPRILSCKTNKTLEPKIRFFQELGLPGSGLVGLVKTDPRLLWRGMDTQIIPVVDYLKELLGSDKVIPVIKRSKWLFSSDAIKRISANVLMLEKYGFSDANIKKITRTNTACLTQSSDWFLYKLGYIEGKLGVSRDSPKFAGVMHVVMWFSESKIEKKMQVFRSFGWTDSELSRLLAAQPCFLRNTEAKIHDRLSFFMKELGYTPLYLTNCSTYVWTLSLEKRVKPRSKVLKILNEMKLINDKPSLVTVLSYSELKFLDFLQRFESDMPGLCESYINSVKSAAD